MCNRRWHIAALEGFEGPFFDGLEPIQHLLAGDPQRINEIFMSDLRKSFKEDAAPRSLRLVSTTDRYQWPFGLCFRHYGREIVVLIPAMLDQKRRHGTSADRHVALYYRGEPFSDEEIDRVARRATAAFEDEYDAQYGHIA